MEFIGQVISAEVVLVSTISKGLKIALQALWGLMVGLCILSILFNSLLLIIGVALIELARQRWFMVASSLAQEEVIDTDLEIEVLAVREIAQDHLESFQVNLGEDLISAQIASFDWSREPLKVDSSYWTDDVDYVNTFRSGTPVVASEVTGESKGEVSVVVAVLAWKDLSAMAKAHGIKIVGKGRTRAVIEAELSKILLGKK